MVNELLLQPLPETVSLHSLRLALSVEALKFFIEHNDTKMIVSLGDFCNVMGLLRLVHFLQKLYVK